MRTATSRRRLRRFVPSNPATSLDSRLEPRSLAAPAFFRLGAQNDNLTLDFALSNVTSFGAVLDGTPQFNASPAAGQSVVSANGTTFTMTGSGLTEVEDLGDPGTGAPVGNYDIAMSFSGQISYVTQGTDPNLVNNLGVTGGVTRTYKIADDAVNETAPVSLVEHFTTFFAPPQVYGSTITGGSNVATTSGFRVVVAVGLTGITNVQFNGTFPGSGMTINPTPGAPSVSGTITPFFGPPGASISYTISSSSVNVTSVSPQGPYGFVTRDGSGNPTGVGFNVNFGAGIGDTAAADPGLTDSATLTAGYDAHFS